MAPTVQNPVEDTLKTPRHVLKKRADANRVLKEREKKILRGEDYRRMEAAYDNKGFLQPLDSDNTKASIYYIRQKLHTAHVGNSRSGCHQLSFLGLDLHFLKLPLLQLASKPQRQLFALLDAGSFVGSVLAGTFAQCLGQFNVITFACYASAILLFCWLKTTSSAGLVVFSLLFGASSGIVIALMMSKIAHTADHPSKIGTYISMATFVVGLASLGGTPIAGELSGNHHRYAHSIVFSAAVIMAGALVFAATRYVFASDKLVA